MSSAPSTGLRLTHPDEVEGYRRYAQAAVPAAQLILAAAAEPPSTRSLLAKVIDRRGAGAATVLRWSRMSAADVVRRYFHSEALLAPALALGPVVWGMSPEAPGTGLGALTYALRHAGAVGRPVGGSGMVPAALLAAFEADGGTVRTRWPVTAINCTSTGVAGVVVGDDTEITARTVVSACDPHRTFLTWLRNPPAGAGPMIERWRTTALHDGYESKLDGLVSSLPTYRSLDPALADRLGFDPMHPTTHVSPPVADIVSGAAMLAQGKVMERPVFYANFPSALDPSMAPEGRHVFSLETLYTPYALPGGWPRSSEPRRWLEQYATLVEPGFLDGLGEWRAMTPDVYEGSFFLPNGHATSFAGGPLAALRSAPAGAHPLPHPDPRPLPHRRGDLPRRRRVGRQRPQLRPHDPRPTLTAASVKPTVRWGRVVERVHSGPAEGE